MTRKLLSYVRIDRGDGAEEELTRESLIDRLTAHITNALEAVVAAEREARRSGVCRISLGNQWARYEVRRGTGAK